LLADPERYGLKVFSKYGDTQGNGRKKPDKTGTMVPVSEGNLPSPVWWTGFEPPVFCDVCNEALMRALEEYGMVPGKPEPWCRFLTEYNFAAPRRFYQNIGNCKYTSRPTWVVP
jgi:hypothetical protein